MQPPCEIIGILKKVWVERYRGAVGSFILSTVREHSVRRLFVRRGFSLVELLVLLALSTLLISLLTPALQTGRERARLLECQSNLRQIGQIQASSVDNDRWGNSPYDVDSDGDGFQPNSGGGGRLGDPTDPTSVESEGHRVGLGFDENLEHRAAEPPAGWRLICPQAEREGDNSFGIMYTAIYRPMSSLYSSQDVIIGCSDYKVVDVVRNFALRHIGEANFLFGDLHVGAHGMNLFSREELSKESSRNQFRIIPLEG